MNRLGERALKALRPTPTALEDLRVTLDCVTQPKFQALKTTLNRLVKSGQAERLMYRSDAGIVHFEYSLKPDSSAADRYYTKLMQRELVTVKELAYLEIHRNPGIDTIALAERIKCPVQRVSNMVRDLRDRGLIRDIGYAVGDNSRWRAKCWAVVGSSEALAPEVAGDAFALEQADQALKQWLARPVHASVHHTARSFGTGSRSLQ
jgi:hypothetical protein